MRYEGFTVPNRAKEIIVNPTIAELQEEYCSNVSARDCGACATCIFFDDNLDSFERWYHENKV